MQRRFGPLFVLLGLSLLVLLARLWDVQVVQHEVWAREAANIVRSYGVEPYTRGAILDRRGRTIVRDEKRYVLEFVWREFRRGHPLGQVAMVRSLALARPVGLDEARGDLVAAALGYAHLSPDDLDAFAAGGELDAGVDYVPSIAAAGDVERVRLARQERRRSRAGDIRFYVERLLGLTRRERKDLRERVDDQGLGDRSFVELSAMVRTESLDDVLRRLEGGVRVRDERLARLAELIEWRDEDVAVSATTDADRRLDPVASPGDRLVALIEERRREVDDDIADALFRLAAGFSPERLDARNLALFDLEWLKSALVWDERRLDEWRGSRGSAFVSSVRAGFAIARSKLGDPESAAEAQWPADRMLSSLAHAFRASADEWEREHVAPQDWRQVDEWAVLDALPRRLGRGDRLPPDLADGVFVFQDESLRASPAEGDELIGLVLGPALDAAPVSIPIHERSERMVELAAETWAEWDRDDAGLVETVLDALFAQLQGRIDQALEIVSGGSGAPIELGDPWIERALETRRYVVRDRGARPKRIGREPSFDLVLLVTRYGDEYAGFRARATTERIPVALGPDGKEPVGAKLIGKVRSPFLVDVLQQRHRAVELVELQRKRRLPEADAQRILEIVDATRRPGEAVGGSGLESWFDDELSGTSGYHEVHGLQDRVDGNRDPIYRGAVDGRDLTLTLDVDVQRAAEEVLLDPALPPRGDRRADDLWFEAPVGAIVLARVDGAILAAASVPLEGGDPPVPGSRRGDALSVADGQALVSVERTLRRPTFQPPGSVVKPLLAAYALEHLGLDPALELEYCDAHRPRRGTSPKRSSRAGYGMIDCNSSTGHSHRLGGRKIGLHDALMMSCNVYFAALGETRFDAASMRDAYEAFGFGRPTGVRLDDRRGRSGLVDSSHVNPASPLSASRSLDSLDEKARQFLGNGLAHIDTNVVQVARAYIALATGRLPTMRLVDRIGTEPVVPSAAPLGISNDALDVVRRALHDVVHHREGTAYTADLRESTLGFRLAAKTGSADYREGLVPGFDRRGDPVARYVMGMRKHAWLAGWFPSDAPRYVVVVYMHDTSATAGHSAVYVAKQFLTSDAVAELVETEL
ncbi:MAG: penicillin-binding transpeptidase domain-containing protein [Planctomycetota bacterium]